MAETSYRPADPSTTVAGSLQAGAANPDTPVLVGGTGDVQLQAQGDSADIDITLVPKGNGVVNLDGVDIVDATGVLTTKIVAFTEDATSTTHTGTVVIPAGAWLHDIRITNGALWGAGSATMIVGDTADDNGYFTGIDLKATDLLVGEVLAMNGSTQWGGKEGAYLVAATGRRGPTTSNFGQYYAAGSTIDGIITVGTPGATTGRTYMVVQYSVGTLSAAVPS